MNGSFTVSPGEQIGLHGGVFRVLSLPKIRDYLTLPHDDKLK